MGQSSRKIRGRQAYKELRMSLMSFDERRQIEALGRGQLARLQLGKLNRVLAKTRSENAFYQQKLSNCPSSLESLEQLSEFPRTLKDELQPAEGEGPFARNLTYEVDRYVRLHQTSGSRGRPLIVLNSAEDWSWWMECWQYVLDAAQITSRDRALLAFSFGPFVGFWSAFDALVVRGALVIPGGGMNSLARIDMIQRADATALFCTPTYALRLAEVAAAHAIDLRPTTITRIVVAGEPGGSVPSVRARIQDAWDARVIDHSGSTEVGPWGYADRAGRGLYINEAEFLPEFISVKTGQPAEEGELSHLLLSTLGRLDSPVIRYQTGDLVRPMWTYDVSSAAAHDNIPDNARGSDRTRFVNRFVFLDGGVLGRADDMMIIRGVNVFPSAVEQILRSFPEVVEYRLTARKRGAMDELVVEVEDHLMQPQRIAEELGVRLGLAIEVRCVTAMSLPRFEGKGQRFVDERQSL
jgi:phenylacetate-CoA ligase